ncbi:MAG: ATP-binding protein, partial [Propionibacteriaceae bacterium]|nr:ATP-binding protein [Propionibacteriaceae bacterium]
MFANLADFEKGYLRRVHPISLHDSTLIVSVSDEFTRTRVESKVRATVEGLLQDFFTRPISVAITIDADLAEDLFFDESAANDDNSLASSFGLTNTPVLGIREGHDEAHLNPKYTFDTFVIGESNRFAHAAAIAVAENPGNAFNPLLIYGDSGLGKTHLLHAIGHYVQNYQDPGERLRVKYVSTEELTNDFINSIAVNKMAEFRRRYREDIDVLLVDDVQFIETRLQTQEEFFHTFNALHTAQKQIVLTSDRHPQALTTLE